MTQRRFFEYEPEAGISAERVYSVLPVPYERSTSYAKGAALAPEAIVRAGSQLELFDEELWIEPGLAAGVLPAVDCSGPREAVFDRISESARAELAAGRFVLALGGEHSVTLPLAEAAAGGENLTVLNIDAHADLRFSYLGDRFSHACVMRRIREQGINTVHAGMRSLCAEEAEYIQAFLVPVFMARDMALAGDGCEKAVLGCLGERVYVSVDVDALDPAAMPGTGTPEPGGLGWHRLLRLLRAVFEAAEVVAADIVETMPVPGISLPEYAAARLAAKIMLYHSIGKNRERKP